MADSAAAEAQADSILKAAEAEAAVAATDTPTVDTLKKQSSPEEIKSPRRIREAFFFVQNLPQNKKSLYKILIEAFCKFMVS